ncbi:hypothetical protein NE237_027947 [Protea cynaroides]|uniref:NmrA-like domain-containing protein n=1 Tax=Protea cynaroides TaxID=273540 RepID=A0A9Q0GRG4_9MAGN|nr:hypothetical protein NE237_027947 [Protea cynaroides]
MGSGYSPVAVSAGETSIAAHGDNWSCNGRIGFGIEYERANESLVDAVKQVDVVICAMSGSFFRSYNIFYISLSSSMQSKKLEMLKRFLPSDQLLCWVGDAKVKVTFLDEDDIATYTLKTIDDPITLNKTIYLRPPENILTHRELIGIWEKLLGKHLDTAEDFLASMKGLDYASQVGVGHFYHIFYEGCLTNFEIGKGEEEASNLYPEVNYTRVDEYLKRFL